MADDQLTVVRATGETETLRARDVGSNVQAQKIDVAPWSPTVVASAQYALVIGTSVVTLTVPATATHALVTVESGDVRFTEDGAAPSGTSGLLLVQGSIAELALPNALKFIRSSLSTAATINVSYRKYV